MVTFVEPKSYIKLKYNKNSIPHSSLRQMWLMFKHGCTSASMWVNDWVTLDIK